MWNRRNIVLAFFIPFLLAGSIYSYFALSYMNTLPESLHAPLDLLYAVFVSFVDMGTTAGVASLVCLSLFSKLLDLYSSRTADSRPDSGIN